MNNRKLILICALSLGLSTQGPAEAFCWPTCPNFIHRLYGAIRPALNHVAANIPQLAVKAVIGLNIAVALYACLGIYGTIRMRPLKQALEKATLEKDSLIAQKVALDSHVTTLAKLLATSECLNKTLQGQYEQLRTANTRLEAQHQSLLPKLSGRVQNLKTSHTQLTTDAKKLFEDFKDDLTKTRAFLAIPEHQ